MSYPPPTSSQSWPPSEQYGSPAPESAGREPAGSTGYGPVEVPRPSRKRRGGLVVGVVLAALLILTGGGVVVFGYLANVGPLKDSGLAACESIRDQSNKNKTNHTTSTWSPEEYHAIRQQFADSRYGDIRDAGTHLVDLIWQIGNMSDDQSLGVVMLAGGKIIESWSSLAGACENHGVTLPILGASSVP